MLKICAIMSYGNLVRMTASIKIRNCSNYEKLVFWQANVFYGEIKYLRNMKLNI